MGKRRSALPPPRTRSHPARPRGVLNDPRIREETFMYSDMTETDVRFRIAAARRILHREGCDSNVGGHVSARASASDGPDAFWVTGFEYFDQTTPDRVCLMGFDLQPRVGELKMSPAVNFHARIYQN